MHTHTHTQYIALLGFAKHCPINNVVLAIQVGRQLARRGLGLAVGNTKGTFHHALVAASGLGGKACAVLEPSQLTWINYTLDSVTRCQSQNVKHQLLAQKADAGIMIGGGPGTEKLMNRLLNQQKPVVALQGSGGITDELADDLIPQFAAVNTAIDHLLNKLDHKALIAAS
jgi:uncharacterized protein (TIGR00725 family)